MPTISDHISVSVLSGTQGITQAGFGTLGICGYHERWAGDEVRTYTSLEAMEEDGFAGTGPSSGPYLEAQGALAQNPRIRRFKIGQRATAPTQITRITPEPQGEGHVHRLTVRDTADTANGGSVEYVEQLADTATDIATALQALLAALTTDATIVDDTGSITVTGVTAGIWTSITGATRSLTIEDETVDAGIAADLSAMEAFDGDFYGVAIDSMAATEIAAAAAWTEARDKLGFFQTRDTAAPDVGESGDVMSTLQAAGYKNCAILYSEDALQAAGSRALGMGLSRIVGSFTWKFKSLNGLTASDLTDSQFSAIKSKNGNYYVATAGVNMMGEGVTPSGQFIDVTRTIHKTKARVAEAIFGLLVRAEKVDFTNSGVEEIALAGLGAIQRMERDGAYVVGSSRYEVLRVEDMDANDVANRIVRGLKYFTTLRGAVHEVALTVRVELPA